MSNELSTEISPEIINSLILTGDMSKLTPGQQTQYYNAVCKSVGINPLTQPFAIIVLQGKKTLYATKGCTQQLSDNRKITTEITERKTIDSVYVVSCRASMPDGRKTDDDGIVSIVGLKGTELANAMMKAVTKSKRRAVLALCGLGMPDETEIDDIPHGATQSDNGKSRIENIVEEATIVKEEVKNATQEQEKTSKSEVKENKPKESKKTTKEKESPVTKKVEDKLKEGLAGIFTVIGLIDNSVQAPDGSIECVKISKEPVMNPNIGVADIKYSFLIQDKRYGTWDTQLAKQIMECIDQRIMVKFEYKERKNEKGNLFNDIVSFKQATADDVN